MQLPQHLQQKNFYDAMIKIKNLPNWQVYYQSGLMMLKAGAFLPLINFTWGMPTVENITKAKHFYGHKNFSWLLPENESGELLLQNGFDEPIDSPEMVLDLTQYKNISHTKKLRIIEVKTEDEFKLWAQTGAKTFGVTTEQLQEFFRPFIEQAHEYPFLGFYEDQPVATSLVFWHDQIAGIYAMSTLNPFRRLGFGTAMANACLMRAKQNNCQQAVLFSSEMGKPMYEKMGFKMSCLYKEYNYRG